MQAEGLNTVAEPEEVLKGRYGQHVGVKAIVPDAKWVLTIS